MEIEGFADDGTARSADDVYEYYLESFSALGLRNACFTYEACDAAPVVLDGVSVEIKKGEYIGAGTGLRSLVDTYVYLQKTALDMDYVAAEAGKLGMAEFEAQSRSLAQRLFSGGELTEAEREMLGYIMSSGVYGTIGHRVENKMAKSEYGKIGYALHRFLVPVSRKNRDYAAYARVYPFFYKYRIFLPLLPFYRTFRAMKAGRFNAEAQAIKNANKDKGLVSG